MAENQQFKERLLRFESYTGLNRSQFERKAGLSTGYIRNFKGSMSGEKIENLLKAFPEINRVWLLTGEGDMIPAHHVPADSEFVQTLLRCYSLYTGEQNPEPIAIGGGTYVHDIPGGVAFVCVFPGVDTKMHAANEQIRVDDLLLSAKIFTQAIFDICGEVEA